jgi:hypothetical protein
MRRRQVRSDRRLLVCSGSSGHMLSATFSGPRSLGDLVALPWHAESNLEVLFLGNKMSRHAQRKRLDYQWFDA